MPSDRGVTIAELLVSLLILSVVTAVVAAGAVRFNEPPAWSERVHRLRDSSVRLGESLRRSVGDSVIRFEPDGTVWGKLRIDTAVTAIDPLTGRVVP